jgi:PknH-like extracellular domain
MARRLMSIMLAGVGVVATACGGNGQQSAKPTQETTTVTSTTTISTPPPRPLAVADLEGLLLDTAEINTAMGAHDMSVIGSYTSMGDPTSELSDPACAVVMPAQLPAYAGSGWMAVRGRGFHEPGDRWTHFAEEDAVSFPSADAATGFFAAAPQHWQSCANRQFTRTSQASKSTWTVEGVFNMNGILTVRRSLEGGDGYACQLALTVRNNVAVDVEACSYDQRDFAINIARQVADRIAK